MSIFLCITVTYVSVICSHLVNFEKASTNKCQPGLDFLGFQISFPKGIGISKKFFFEALDTAYVKFYTNGKRICVMI